MGLGGKLSDIVDRQKQLTSDLESEYRALEDSDVAKENAELRADVAKLREDNTKISDDAAALADENKTLKNTLYEHIFNERNAVVDMMKGKLDIYFRSEIAGEINRLAIIEGNVKSRIQQIKNTMAANNIDMGKEFNDELDALSASLDKKVTEARAAAANASGPFSPEEREQLDALKKEEISDEQIRAVAKKNNLERFVGLNVLNVIGILLLVVGAVAAMRYTYLKLSDNFKGLLIFVLGGIMLGAGEFFNRKKPTIFSLGLSAGGIAILYVALATSYFALHILDMYPAIGICILLTAGAFVLSNRYNSQIIATFALIGGYLPMFSIIETGNNATTLGELNALSASITALTYGTMAYFVVLNLFALGIAWYKRWRVTAFIGLALTIIGTACIHWFGTFPDTLSDVIMIIYVAFAFLIYTAIPLVSTYRHKTVFRKSDVVLLAINTTFSSLIMYVTFYRFGYTDYTGWLAIAFSACYLGLGWFIENKFAEKQPHTTILFYLTGLAFVVLFIPLQFGKAWLSMGWLAEGIVLAVYGILRDEKRFKCAGLIICGLCVFAFLIFDVFLAVPMWNSLFTWKYSALTLGSLIILGSFMYKKIMSGQFASVYKYFALVNFWFYALYMISEELKKLIRYFAGILDSAYLTSAISITATFFIAYGISRIKLLSTLGTKILAIIMYFVGIIWMFALTGFVPPVAWAYIEPEASKLMFTIVGTILIVVLSLLCVLAMRDAVRLIVTQRKKGIEWLPLIVSGYFVLLLTQNLISQYNLHFSSVAISIIYVLAALAWIVFGFVKRFAFIRRFGLALAIFAVAKLFLIDLATLTQGYRIVSYFALGITLIAISFVYQYFSKRLELKEGMTIHAKE